MARPKSTNTRITVRVPGGIKISKSILAEATSAAQAVVNSVTRYASIAKDLAAQGIDISAEELAARAAGGAAKAPAKAPAKKRGGRPAGAVRRKSSGKRRRTVLSDAQREGVVADLKTGATVSSVAKKYKCSPQTVMTIKGKAGLVKKKTAKQAAKKKVAAKKRK